MPFIREHCISCEIVNFRPFFSMQYNCLQLFYMSNYMLWLSECLLIFYGFPNSKFFILITDLFIFHYVTFHEIYIFYNIYFPRNWKVVILEGISCFKVHRSHIFNHSNKTISQDVCTAGLVHLNCKINPRKK